MTGWVSSVVDVKGAFLHGKIEDNEEIHMEVPKGFEKHYDDGVVLKLRRFLYGLEQAAMAFWKQLLKCMKDMNMERSTADPCLYYDWTPDGLVMIVSWIDDTLIVGSNTAVAKNEERLMSRFDCEDCGELDGYVGYKITRIGNDAVKFTHPVILQNYADEFELPNHNFPTPATAGDCLTKCEEKDALGPVEHTKYRSGVGKMMYVMKYSLLQTYNAVRDQARHMS